MQSRTSFLGYLNMAATLTAAATVLLTLAGRVQYSTATPRTIALMTLSVAVLLFVSTDSWKERCIAVVALGAGCTLLAAQAALSFLIIYGGSI